MIDVSFYKKDSHSFTLVSKGHAFYSKKGSDIICSAYSHLLQTFIRCLELENGILSVEEIDGLKIDFYVSSDIFSERIESYINFFLLGALDLESMHGKYIKINIK